MTVFVWGGTMGGIMDLISYNFTLEVPISSCEHFSVANIELFHMVCSIPKNVSTKNRPFHGY